MKSLGTNQTKHILNINLDHGIDDLLVEEMNIRETISELFSIEIHVRSKKDGLNVEDLIGKSISSSLQIEDGENRHWHGLVTDVCASATLARDTQSYRLTLQPQLWLLSQRRDCRIWLNKTSVEVCQTLLSEHGLDQQQLRGLFKDTPKQHYSVQYNETDLEYLTRRLEQDGIFYWFEHEKDKHTLCLANDQSGYQTAVNIPVTTGESEHDHITRLEKRLSLTPSYSSGSDWNFEKPDKVLEGKVRSVVDLPNDANYDMFQYPAINGYGHGARASEGIENETIERDARLRMLATEAKHKRIEGKSRSAILTPGARFTPVDRNSGDKCFEPCVIFSIEHKIVDTSFERDTLSEDSGDSLKKQKQQSYTNQFLALPADTPAVPERRQPGPRIDGTQVAVVAAPEEEEILTDEYGRVKVWFPWDRRAKKNGSDTCWIRVMQNWAGAGWGTQVIPRKSMEVLVSYADGDPDRPNIIGVVPNKKQKVPYSLPKHKTRSTFKSNTHKGSGCNEMRFEDMAGGQEVFFHAEKDFHTGIKNNQNTHIGGYKHSQINKNETKHVLGTRHQHSNLSTSISAGKDFVISAGQRSRFRGTNSKDFHKSSRYYVNYQKISDSSGTGADGRNGSVYISSEYDTSLNVGESLNLNSGKNASLVAREGISLSSEQNIRISAQDDVIQSSEEKFIITAEDVLVLKCGKAHIAMKANGDIELVGNIVSAKGKKILLN